MDYDKNKEIIANLFQRMRALSISFAAILKNEKMQRFFQEQMELRKKISEIFSNYCGGICRQCKGDCCHSYVWLHKKDLLLFLSQGGLNFPEPEWDFVSSKNCCIFLSNTGCILKEFRPWQCLKHICNKFYTTEKIDAKVFEEIAGLVYQYEFITNKLAGEMQQKWHLTIE